MRKIVKYGICGLAAMMLLAGCSKKEADTETTTTAEETTESTPAETKPADLGSVVLGEYKGLEIEGFSTAVTDEEVEAEISNILAENPSYVEDSENLAKLGDIVNIDYVGLKDDVAFDGGTDTDYNLELGSGSFIDGFEDGLVGVKKGDTLDLNLTFPEVYGSAELAGQDVVFQVTVNSIDERVDAELNDEFVLTMTEFATVEGFREDVKAGLIAGKEEEAEYVREDQALLAAMENATFECNPEVVEAEYQSRVSVYDSMAQAYGVTREELLASSGVDEAEFETQIRELAENVIKQQLLIEAVAEAEGLEVDDVIRQKVADMQGMELAALIETYGQESVDQVALPYAVAEFLAESAVVK